MNLEQFKDLLKMAWEQVPPEERWTSEDKNLISSICAPNPDLERRVCEEVLRQVVCPSEHGGSVSSR